MSEQAVLNSSSSAAHAFILAILPSAFKAERLPMEEVDEAANQLPSPPEVVQELKRVGGIAGPMVLVGLLLYTKAMVSMLFLGRLGELELAGGSLAIGFANITGYSVLSGLATGMEPICAQAFGAKRWKLIGLALQRTLLLLLFVCLPISFLWLNVEQILLHFGQEPVITAIASSYLAYSLPDLLAQAALNPLRIYLRTQTITRPLTWCAACALIVHILINIGLVQGLGMGIRGVALANALTDCYLVGLLVGYIRYSGHMQLEKSWEGWSRECLRDWEPLVRIAIPSCVSVCLEWWWYELMIILSGLLHNAQVAVATMGILIQTTSLVYIFPSALSLAVSTRVGNELGANRPARARVAALVALGCATLVAALAATFTTGMRHVWGSFFTKNAAVLELTALALPIVGLCELGNCPQTTVCGVLRGSARPSMGANINLGSFYLVGLPVAITLGFYLKLGFLGLWFGLLSAQATCVLLMVPVLLRTDWTLQAERAKQLAYSTNSNSNSSTTNTRDVAEGSNLYKLEAEEVEALFTSVAVSVVKVAVSPKALPDISSS